MSGKNKKKSKSSGKISTQSYKKQILTHLGVCDKKFINLSELAKKCRTKKYGYQNWIDVDRFVNYFRTSRQPLRSFVPRAGSLLGKV